MALTLYRRHRRDCQGGHSEDSRSSELEERKKTWRGRCDCPIFASGTLARRFKRQSTERVIWSEARAVAEVWESAQSWDGKPPVTLPAAPEPEAPSRPRITIADASKIFLGHREGAQIAPATLRKYKGFVRQLTAFADSRGYVMLDQFTSGDVDLFYASVKLGPRAKGKWLGTLRSFFRFAMNRKWLPENPVSPDIKPPIGANRLANKAPFTNDELERIIAACDRIGTIEWQSGQRRGTWTGEDVKDFIWVMTYTGLRISDVAFFHMDRLKHGEVFLRAKKNGGDVFTFVPDWLESRLRARAEKCGIRPFLVGQSERLETVTDMWRRKINKVFELAGRFEETPTPHRFRHTFARILLERGVPVSDVADLLGDDEKTVREHYARWVPERQARLTRILREAFADKPKNKIIPMRA